MYKTEISHVILLPDMLSFLLFLFSEEGSQVASNITSFVFPWKIESGATFIHHCLV